MILRTVAIVAGSKSTATALCGQLSEFIAGQVAIKPYWVDDGVPKSIEGDLVILSSSLVHADLLAAGLSLNEHTIIVASRIVDCDALERVVALEPGAKALFVNDTPETVDECLASLRDLGLDYMDWQGWYPGSPPPKADYNVAVVAGEPGLVPVGIGSIIDIGVRIFDFGTLAEILARLGIPNTDIGRYSRRYLAKIVSLARRLARSTEEAKRLSGHLGSVIDSLHHGILVYDPRGLVSVCNDELREILSIRASLGPHSNLATLIRQRELLAFLECRCGEEEAIFKLPSGSYIVSRFDLEEGEHSVAVFRSQRDEEAEATRIYREYRRRGHVAKWSMDDIIGDSEAMKKAKRIATRLAATDLSILINGESGTGKELFASAMHAVSARSSGPFLAVNLGSLSDDLIESELFGYVEGAFTGASKGGKPGLFELADGGTLFLDEIGSISTKVQTRLLRVLQEKEVMRVGSSDIQRVDVRIIAATKEDLLEKSLSGTFREDLYFRLKMGWIRIPALRERLEDIPTLVGHFVSLEGCSGIYVAPEVIADLSSRTWPGNVRELGNTITYMLAVREGDGLYPEDMPAPAYFTGWSSRPRTSASTVTQPVVLEDGYALRDVDRMTLLAVATIEATGKHAGRATITAMTQANGLGLGEGGVRASMSRLEASGLLITSRGRGGSSLSAEGRRLAACLRNARQQ